VIGLFGDAQSAACAAAKVASVKSRDAAATSPTLLTGLVIALLI
jgi:hypothetical protein